ncbi:ECF transporter S component [Companilactobacillus ginsenosidimutans]|uniref:Membrane protein n=1 Tax=Companilactobacillus ginsenosidimutans TaxID=1007676 RepID=A0A0H4QCZ1_9LACO|nr:ECF transporter S component [Companilactobacillus ginsenosidimutans]AKP66204.1 membrane protein [Companilactobacillus ginsenosidimutans]
MNNTRIKKLTFTAIILALCIVGANIKIMGSVALDSFPAFFGALALGPVAGAFLGLFGHLVSALLSGFPLTLPVHLIIGFCMMVTMAVYALIRRGKRALDWKYIILSDVVAYALNVPLELVLLYPILKQAVYVYFTPLTIAAIVNIILAEVVFILLKKRFPRILDIFKSEDKK